MPARVHIFVEGRVQGVFFRAKTMEEAKRRGLTGWVRNLPDGKVEAVFEGEREWVEDMIRWCQVGPRLAEVSDVALEWQDPGDEMTTFTIRY